MTLAELLEHTYLTGGFTTRSDLARQNAELVIDAVEQGFLTTTEPRGGRGKVLRLTRAGFDAMFQWVLKEFPQSEFLG